MKPTLLLIAALALAGPVAAQAPSDDRLEAAAALMDAMDMERMMKETLEQTLAIQTRVRPAHGGGAGADSLAAATREVTRKYATRALEWSTVRDEITLLYAQTFTLDELRQIEELYRSPAGRLLLEANPELMAGMQAISARRMQAVMPEMMREMMEVVRGAGAS